MPRKRHWRGCCVCGRKASYLVWGWRMVDQGDKTYRQLPVCEEHLEARRGTYYKHTWRLEPPKDLVAEVTRL